MQVSSKANAKTVAVGLEMKKKSNLKSAEPLKATERKVPDQLVMEFLINLMKRDYVMAEKLCKMILMYDPEHEQALSFKPLLKEMIQAIKDNEENDSETDTESSSGSDSNEEEDSTTTEESTDSDTSESEEQDQNEKE